ncbi:ABC transporter permease [Corynebacterium jeikeium]|uniref:Putative ABC transport system, permease protein n=1 Tax=Corynebacterium jeikeium (strain K411) TaxID=306537 RepID=Q4JXA0_CORJK|nr:FtsX-like permease family protein [Corynebacterium jeikeium]CAI36557.1 putative ABC transport system, permease protein [Corynebacterium jeikeium K411]SUY83837.1 ABC transporter permease [Corynebacterium jeikeium]
MSNATRSAKHRGPTDAGKSHTNHARAVAKVSYRSVLANKVRFLLTILAVVLGTAFISGSLMFTDMMQKSFDGVFSNIYSSVDVEVTQKDPTKPITQETREKLEQHKDVKGVAMGSETSVVVAKDNKQLSTGGAPSVVAPNDTGADSPGPAITVVDGREPKGAKEAIINSDAAEKHGVHIGDTLKAIDVRDSHEYTIVGIYDTDFSVGGYLGLALDTQVYIDRYTNGTFPDGFWLSAKDGVTAEQLKESVQEDFPEYEVVTGDSIVEKATQEIQDGLSFVNYFLLAFALVSLLVGAFIIANTFSMVIAQRIREFALLRSLGASRGQLTTSVVFEAVLVGVVGSALGILAGMGLAKGIFAIMDMAGFGLPSTGLSLTLQAVLLPLIIGVLITVASAWSPARRAGRVHPVEAMRSGDVSSASPLKLRTISGAIVFLLGVAAAVVALVLKDADTGARASILGVGSLLVILGTFLVSPALSIPVVPALGRVLGAPFGTVGKLASTNSRRNPRRTATTAFALTLGVALVAAFGMVGATMKSAMEDMIGDTVKSDLVVSGPQNQGFPLPQGVEKAVDEADGVGSHSTLGVAPVSVGKPLAESNVTYAGNYAFYFKGPLGKSMGLSSLGEEMKSDEPGFYASENKAKAMKWKVGDKVPMYRVGQGEMGKIKLLGIYTEPLQSQTLLNEAALKPFVGQGKPLDETEDLSILQILVHGDGNISEKDLKDNVSKAVEPFIVADVLTPTEYAGTVSSSIDQMLMILNAMLALSILVAILGIINTLALNVIERRQEIGMLRAVGMFRKQVRRMITLEAVQIAIYGALVGVLIGVGLGWVFVKVLASEGLDNAVLPWQLLTGMIVGSGIVGVLAALWPAHKAAKTTPLEAIAD